MFREHVRVGQQLTAALHKQLALSRQAQSPSDVLEQGDTELCLQRIDLTRGCGLAEIQARAGSAEAAVLGRRDEGSQNFLDSSAPQYMLNMHDYYFKNCNRHNHYCCRSYCECDTHHACWFGVNPVSF